MASDLSAQGAILVISIIVLLNHFRVWKKVSDSNDSSCLAGIGTLTFTAVALIVLFVVWWNLPSIARLRG